MSFNWSQIGTTLTGLTSALTAAGVSSANLPTILNQIGAVSNPNQSEELAICSQIMIASGNPALVQALAIKLATESGIPADAAAVAMTLTAPGADVTSKVLQIEQLIKQGG